MASPACGSSVARDRDASSSEPSTPRDRARLISPPTTNDDADASRRPDSATPASSIGADASSARTDPADRSSAATRHRGHRSSASLGRYTRRRHHRDDNATTRDFLLDAAAHAEFEEFNGREKISYPPSGLDTVGSPGHDPENGDLIYFVPWGNLGFYYNADGIEFDDSVVLIGSYEATPEQLVGIEGDVSISIVG